MQKNVKFLFTLSALSATEFIFGILSDLRAVSATIKRLSFWSDSKGLKMKTYTLTWRHKPFFGTTLSRVRFDCKSVYWPWHRFYHELQFDTIFAFSALLSRRLDASSYRLLSCGRLVARSATY